MARRIFCYNLRQCCFAGIQVLLGLVLYAVIFSVCSVVPGEIRENWRLFVHVDYPDWLPETLGIAVVLIVTLLGVQHWRGDSRDGEPVLDSIAPYAPDSGLSYYGRSEMRSWALDKAIVTNTLLGAPYQLLHARRRIRNLIPVSADAIRRLGGLYDEILAREVWHPLKDYSGRELEVGMLIRLGLVDFGHTQMKIKARSVEDGRG